MERISRTSEQEEIPQEETLEARGDWVPRQGLAPAPKAWQRPSVKHEKRSLDRVSQRELGKVAVALRLPGGEWVPVKLWDFSCLGFGVTCPANDGTVLKAVKENDEILLSLSLRSASFEVWCQVRNLSNLGEILKIGLRRLDVNMPHAVDRDRRENFRLPLAPSLALKGRIRHPFLYGHVCAVRVSDMNRRLGFSLVSNDPAILLFEGMEIDVCYDLPGLRSTAMRGRVVWVFASEADEVRFGFECLDMDWLLHRGLCNYLLYSRNWTPALLRDAGFKAQQVKGHLRFRTVKTMEEYAEVLHLRRDAYVSVGKRSEETTPEQMANPLDGISRILMARHNRRIVGSLTFTFPGEDTVLDSQAGFPGSKYPVQLPPKTNLIEVSRLCISADYRGTDLLQGLFEHGLKHFLLSDRHWLLTSATEDLLPLYESIGFKRLKASYRHPGLNLKEHHLIIAHKSAFLRGSGMGLLLWNAVFGDLVRHLLDKRLLSTPPWSRALIRLRLLFRPLARLAVDGKARRGFRKHLRALRDGRLRAAKPASPAPENEA